MGFRGLSLGERVADKTGAKRGLGSAGGGLPLLLHSTPFSPPGTTAAKIRMQPDSMRGVRLSCRKIVLKRTPKTDSKSKKWLSNKYMSLPCSTRQSVALQAK